MDFAVIADSTLSMVEVQKSVQQTLAQVFKIGTLTGAFRRLGLLRYADYTLVTRHPVTAWSGWCESFVELKCFLEQAELFPGGDEPEACKTALVQLLGRLREDGGKTLVFWYADAPPHHPANDEGHPNHKREMRALGDRFDWIKLCIEARDRGCVVVPILGTADPMVTSFFLLLATVTGGRAWCFEEGYEAERTTRETIAILGSALGMEASAHFEPHSRRPLAYRKKWAAPLDDRGEDDLPGYLPSVNKAKKPAQVIRVEIGETGDECGDECGAIKPVSPKNLRKRFATDHAFAQRVFDVFWDLTQDAEQILALTYNAVFSTLWREIVRRHADSRRPALLLQFQRAINAMDPEQKNRMRAWLEAGYDASEEIAEAIEGLPPFPAFVLQQAVAWRPQELIQATSSCDPKDLSRIAKMLARIEIAPDSAGGSRTSAALPMALPSEQLFPMLPHLMCPGLVFLARPSAIMAMLAIVSKNAFLEKAAREYLERVRGKWMDPEHPQNHAFGFVRLATHLADIALTAEELETVRTIKDVQSFLMNRGTELNLEVPLARTVREDYLLECGRCAKRRSFTLMTREGWCGPCASGYEIAREPNTPQASTGPSNMYECRSCSALYAVIETERLKVSPRCHFCRAGGSPPVLRCVRCRAAFVSASDFMREDPSDFVCAACAAGERAQQVRTETIAASFAQLFAIETNRDWMLAAVGLAFVESDCRSDCLDVFAYKSSFRLRKKIRRRTPEDLDPPAGLTYAGRSVQNLAEIKETLRAWVARHRAELGMCMMCCEEFKKELLKPACGRKGCETRCCGPCLDTWYGELRPGSLLSPANMVCAFCKRAPSPKVLTRHNPEACQLLRVRPPEGYDPAFYYGWCVACMRPRQWMEKVCAQDPPTAAENFRCENCDHLTKARRLDVRDCPGCGATVEKTFGCDHITCRCSVHFCWRCGERQDPREIYGHIYRCTGDEIYRSFLGADARMEMYNEDDWDD
jgi:hypothetical protein